MPMKLRSYHMFYQLFSYLSDRTNGASFFVKYKLLLGTLIIGVANTVVAKASVAEVPNDTIPSKKNLIKCYETTADRNISDTVIIKGKVVDRNKEPLVAVSIIIKQKPTIGTLSNIDGDFTLRAKENDILVFSFFGFENVEIVASEITKELIVMKEDTTTISISCYIVVESPQRENKIKITKIEKPKVEIRADSIALAPFDLTKSMAHVMCYGIVLLDSKSNEFSYDSVDEKPIPPVCELDDLGYWIEDNLKYSEQMLKDEVEGYVEVSFAIDKKGKVVDKKVTRKLSHDADKEALRVLSSSGRWQPGRYNGKAVKITEMDVRVYFSLP